MTQTPRRYKLRRAYPYRGYYIVAEPDYTKPGGAVLLMMTVILSVLYHLGCIDHYPKSTIHTLIWWFGVLLCWTAYGSWPTLKKYRFGYIFALMLALSPITFVVLFR